MPEMDGVTAALKIQNLFPNKPIFIVAVSGHIAERERNKCKAVGMKDFFCKPITLLQIEQSIEYLRE